MQRYVWNLLIAVDQLLNAMLGGDPDETISSRVGKMAMKGSRIGKIACRVLNFFDKGHCEKSIEYDEGRPI
jgi:hypothetical protein